MTDGDIEEMIKTLKSLGYCVFKPTISQEAIAKYKLWRREYMRNYMKAYRGKIKDANLPVVEEPF